MPNVTIQWFAGRTDQQRREITVAITDALVRHRQDVRPDQVHIVFRTSRSRTGATTAKLAGD